VTIDTESKCPLMVRAPSSSTGFEVMSAASGMRTNGMFGLRAGEYCSHRRADRYGREIHDADAGRKSVVLQERIRIRHHVRTRSIFVNGANHVADPEQLRQ